MKMEATTISDAVGEIADDESQLDGSQQAQQRSQQNPAVFEHTIDYEEKLGPGEWWYAEGIKGEGEKPEWFDDKKYKYVVDQAKGLPGLRKELSKLPGAPEDYEISFDEELADFDLSGSETTLDDFKNLAKELRINQEGFNKIVNFYAKNISAQQESVSQEIEQYAQQEMEKLGPNAKEELSTLMTWARNNLPNEMMDAFRHTLVSAENVQVMNYIRSNLMQNSNIPAQSEAVTAKEAALSLRQKLADPRYGVDTMYTNMVDEEYKRHYG